MVKKIIDYKTTNAGWVFESILLRELYPSLIDATYEERYEHKKAREKYQKYLSNLEHSELMREFNKKLSNKYQLLNFNDEKKEK